MKGHTAMNSLFSARAIFLAVIVLATAFPVRTADANRLRDMLAAQGNDQTQNWNLREEESPFTSLPLPPGTGQMNNKSFGADEKQALDIYLPPAPENAPVIVMVHGGAWMVGDKANKGVANNKAAYWLPKGFVVVSVNYRLVPDVTPLQQADDVAAALVYVQNHAVEWGGDPEKIVLMGHSAGAHLVALLAADPERYKAAGLKRWSGTVILDSAALDLVSIMKTPHMKFYDRVFGADISLWKAASPLHRLLPAATPMMIVCSTQRKDSPCLQAHAFAAKVRSLGVEVLVLPRDKSHGRINVDVGVDTDYTKAIDQFISGVIKE